MSIEQNVQQSAWVAPVIAFSDDDSNYPGDPARRYFTISKIYSSTSTDFLPATIAVSPGMAAGNQVRFRIETAGIIYDAPIQTIGSGSQPLRVDVPKAMLYGASGQSSTVNFALRVSSQSPWSASQSRYYRVQTQSLNELTAPSLARGTRRVTVQYPRWTSAHQVRIRGFTLDGFQDTEWKAMANGSAYFDLPLSWFQANQGKQVWMNYAVRPSAGSDFQFSRILHIASLAIPT